MTITSQDVQKYVRILLQWLAAFLVSKGALDPNSAWTTPIMGILVGAASLGWTMYGSRVQAKIDDFMKVVNLSPEAMAALDQYVKVAILNAATKVPGTEKVVNPTMASDPTTTAKVTTQ